MNWNLCAAGKGPEVQGLWTKPEATDVHAFADSTTGVIWGRDMEEEQPELIIRELARLNPGDPDLNRIVELTKDGYDRSMAPRLLLLKQARGTRVKCRMMSLFVRTSEPLLQIETDRLNPETKMVAQQERERRMKTRFLEHLAHSSGCRRRAHQNR